MSGFEGFGKRIHGLRKERGMTQEELASRLGISSQAVSKWENEDSYPDITLIPTIATILDTTVNYLFGIEDAPVLAGVSLPEFLGGMPLVHQYNHVGCYSDKEVLRLDGSSIRFVDGSVAELSNCLVTNTGIGEIRTFELEHQTLPSTVDASKTTASFDFGMTESLNVKVRDNSVLVLRSADDQTHVRAKGHPLFIHLLRVELDGNTLMISFADSNSNEPMKCAEGNSLEIEVPYDMGDSLRAVINGQGTFRCDIPYETAIAAISGSGDIIIGDSTTFEAKINGSGGITACNAQVSKVQINGSGDIKGQCLGELQAKINGSGDIHVERVKAVSMGINGSGDVKIGAVEEGDVSVAIMGSGDVRIEGGRCGKFDVNIAGDGSVKAPEVIADTANLVLSAGEVVLGRVVRQSVEQIKKTGVARILARGKIE